MGAVEHKPIERGLLSRKTVSKLGVTFNEACADTSMDFGRRMMAKMGWSEGKGLGKGEDGMTEHIRVKQRADQLGLGADEKPATQWAPPPDAIAAGLAAKAEKKRKREKKKAKAAAAAGSAAGPAAGGSDSDSDESEGEREVRRRLAGSGVLPGLSDEALFEICGGARLHRGSRSGTGGGKLARTADADAAFLAKYGGADSTAAPDAAQRAIAACADEAQAKASSKKAKHAEKAAAAAAAAAASEAARKAERKAARRAEKAAKQKGAGAAPPSPRQSPRLAAAATAAAALPTPMPLDEQGGDAAAKAARKAARKAERKAAKAK